MRAIYRVVEHLRVVLSSAEEEEEVVEIKM